MTIFKIQRLNMNGYVTAELVEAYDWTSEAVGTADPPTNNTTDPTLTT